MLLRRSRRPAGVETPVVKDGVVAGLAFAGEERRAEGEREKEREMWNHGR